MPYSPQTPLDEARGQQRDVPLPPLPQRWQVEHEHGQAVIEVLAELSLAHRAEQRLVGRGDDGDVGRLAAGAAPRRRTLPCSSTVSSLACRPWGEQPDLVEEERPAVGEMEEPRLGLTGVGESAPLVPEQLGLERVSGIAAQLSSTNGPLARGPERCISRARRPFPRPVSPGLKSAGDGVHLHDVAAGSAPSVGAR